MGALSHSYVGSTSVLPDKDKIFIFFWLKQFKIRSLEAPSSITCNHKSNPKPTYWFCLHVYMTLMCKATKFEASDIHTSETIEE